MEGRQQATSHPGWSAHNTHLDQVLQLPLPGAQLQR